MIGDWWLVLSFEQLLRNHDLCQGFVNISYLLGMKPKTLTHQSVIEEFKNSWTQSGKASLLSIFWWRKALVGLSWLIHHILLLLHRTHLPLPRWHPRTRKNDMFSATYGEIGDPTLGCQSLPFAGWLQNLILSYLNACDSTAWSSCIVMWNKVPQFMMTLTYIQLVRVHSHLQTTPLMM